MARKKGADEEAAETTTEAPERGKIRLRGKKEGGEAPLAVEESPSAAPQREAAPVSAPAANNPPRENGQNGKKMEISEFKNKSMNELVEMALSVGVENPADLKKPALIFSILQKQSDNPGLVYAEGVLEVMPDGYGFLRSASYNYLAGPDDIYVSPAQIRMFALRKGD
ncbi:MAG TPA: Rho termination factor N-terminal domain-containing protein, partial [Turneriella sp.]|nr:Rho termination factor N-terminal domain-containing protein [Turneriella sp.]